MPVPESDGERDHRGARGEIRAMTRLFDEAPLGFVVLDAHGSILHHNDRASALLGFGVESLLGRKLPDIVRSVNDDLGRTVPDEERPFARAARRLRGEGPRVYGLDCGRAERRVWLEVTTTVSRSATGDSAYVALLFSDATKRIETERQRRLLAAVADRTDNAVVVTDLQRRIEWVNDAFTRLTGYSQAESIGKNPGEMLQGDGTAQDIVASMRRSLDSGRGFHEEVLNYTREGESRWFDLEVQPLMDAAGNHTHWMGIKRDVTERRVLDARTRRMAADAQLDTRALEAMLKRTKVLMAEAMTATRAKDRFLRNLSHEIRTPLQGILGSVELLLDLTLDSEARTTLEDIRVSGERLLRTLTNVLQFAQIKSDEIVAQPKQVTLEGTIAPLREAFLESARTRGVDFEVVVPEEPVSEILLDDALLQRSLSLLIENAFEFIDHGKVALLVRADAVAGGWELRFEVRDTGEGVRPADFERIFDPFVQVDDSLRRRHEGLGLGLAIAKGLVEVMGGTIDVRNDLDGSTCFVVRLTVATGGSLPDQPCAPPV